MPKTQITTSKIRKPSGHFSQATSIAARGRFVFISGTTIAGDGDIEVQTQQVCENIKAAVEQAGGTMDDICRVDVYVRNMEHFERCLFVRGIFYEGFRNRYSSNPSIPARKGSTHSTVVGEGDFTENVANAQ
jgi:2-iminobutanoate/2-iminopropanoate deaminase